ncbi:MAG TPA: T9SS type A sorting domain-containing protein [Flavobacteriales bacterium]|nr:T9SS type A sorting domain-containing protein [Flavobacteriales bacterium]
MMKNYFTSLVALTLLLATNVQGTYAQTTPDPGIPGPLAVTKMDYDLGDLAFTTSTSFPSSLEVRGNIHFPTGLSGGPYPVIINLHGRHSTCFETADPSNTDLAWPCAPGYESITSFEGYDYFATFMASHGYIVISISANGINAHDNSSSDYGMDARGELTQHHCDLWNTWTTVGDTLGLTGFGSMFVGKLNMQNIGTMGHSRGGEGVVKHALLNYAQGSPYHITCLITLAPVDFHREILNGIPMMNISPYCDGDVSDLQGVYFYDDTRYNDTSDHTARHQVLMLGTNHNFYNTVWTPGLYPAGGSDDWDDIYGSSNNFCGTSGSINKRLTPSRQQAAYTAYASAFYRYYMEGDTSFAPILHVDDLIPPTSSTLDSSEVFVSWHAEDTMRLDINRVLMESSEVVNTLGGTASQAGLFIYDVCSDDLSAEIDCNLSFSHDKEPHSGSGSELGMPQLEIEWDNDTAWWENILPAANQDISGFRHFQFRFGVNFSTSLADTPVDFAIELTDVLDSTASLNIADYTNANYFPPGSHFLCIPKVMFNSVKIPLSDFSGIDLEQIKKVTFRFNNGNDGAILINELCLTGKADVQNTTGTTLENISQLVAVYPNPAQQSINVSLGNMYENVSSIELHDIHGKLVYAKNRDMNSTVTLDINNMSKGVYVLSVKTSHQLLNYKIVKQ